MIPYHINTNYNIDMNKINYNSFTKSEDEKINKCLKKIIKIDKNEIINKLSEYYRKLTECNTFNIMSDYKENSNYKIINENYNNVLIIFNIKNFERLILDTCVAFILIDLNNFSNDFKIVNKYINRQIWIVPSDTYLLYGKIWLYVPIIITQKFNFLNYYNYISDFDIYLLKYSTISNYIRYLIKKYNYDVKKIKKHKILDICNNVINIKI